MDIRKRDRDPELVERLREALQVGSVVVAARRTGVCEPGEVGVCYECYEIDGRPGWSVIFRGGRYDGFSPGKIEAMLLLTGLVCGSLQGYRFENVTRLDRDYAAGLFDEAFARVPETSDSVH